MMLYVLPICCLFVACLAHPEGLENLPGEIPPLLRPFATYKPTINTSTMVSQTPTPTSTGKVLPTDVEPAMELGDFKPMKNRDGVITQVNFTVGDKAIDDASEGRKTQCAFTKFNLLSSGPALNVTFPCDTVTYDWTIRQWNSPRDFAILLRHAIQIRDKSTWYKVLGINFNCDITKGCYGLKSFDANFTEAPAGVPGDLVKLRMSD